MHKVWIVGAGKIGTAIACFLSEIGTYEVHLTDINLENDDVKRLLNEHPIISTVKLDIQDKSAVHQFLNQNPKHAAISCLPYYLNAYVAEYAREFNLHYFDLTEDIGIAARVMEIAEEAETAFVPRCGLGPGAISILANGLMQHFDTLDVVKLRVGGIPETSSNELRYALTWSIDGVINQYCNLCPSIQDGKLVFLHPLEGLEELHFDGGEYEAFNTSGGVGTLAETYEGRVNYLTYKTLRYPGHCERMRFLINDLHLNSDRNTLKRIIERAVPWTKNDLVLLYISVTGYRKGNLIQETYFHKFYPTKVADLEWSAIQFSTASALCAVVDIVLTNPQLYKGLIKQEQINLKEFFNNRFGKSFVRNAKYVEY